MFIMDKITQIHELQQTETFADVTIKIGIGKLKLYKFFFSEKNAGLSR